MSRMMLSEPMPWEPPPFEDDGMDSFFGAVEIDKLNRLPKRLVDALAEESNDPEFVAYLVGVLRAPDPYAALVDAMGKELAAEQMGLDGYLGYVGMDGLDHLGKSFFKRVGSAIKRVAKKVIIDPHKKVFQTLKKVEKKVVRGAEKVWRKYGNIILTVVGAVLAPFTGGASMAAASVLIAANTMYAKKKAADAAKRAAKKEAGQLQAEADTANAQVMQQVDQFYRDNQAWFIEHGITPDKWAQLTLDQKIDIINAGAKGTLPVGIGPVVDPNTGQPVSTPPGGGMPPAGTIVGPPPGGIQPPPSGGGATWGGGGGGGPRPGGAVQEGGGGGEASYGPPPGGGAPADAGPTVGTFDLMVEGQPAGTFPTLEEAARGALAKTTPGDRFEVYANGKSTGLRVRTSSGSIDVPADLVAQVRGMARDKMGEFVAQAEKDTKGGGGIPWGWILLAAGGAAKITGII